MGNVIVAPVSPEAGDADVWAALSRTFIQALGFVQMHGGTMIIAAAFAWLLGMESGYKGTTLRVKIALAAMLAYVGVPVALYYLDLDGMWVGVLSALIGAQGSRLIKWFELLSLKRLGLDKEDVEKRHDTPWDGKDRRNKGANRCEPDS